jgi:hypothetical protein
MSVVSSVAIDGRSVCVRRGDRLDVERTDEPPNEEWGGFPIRAEDGAERRFGPPAATDLREILEN